MKSVFIANVLICVFLFFLLLVAENMLWGSSEGAFVDSEYDRLARDFKFLSALLPKVNSQTNSLEFQRVAVETFNTVQSNIQITAKPHSGINPFTIDDIEFYFDEEGFFQRAERDEIELVNYEPGTEIIATPSLSYVFGKGNPIVKFNQGGHLMFIGIIIIVLFLFALIQYVRFEFWTKNLRHIIHSGVTLLSVNFLCFASLFFWNHQSHRGWFVSANHKVRINVEYLLQTINDAALYPSLLFDIMIVSFVLTMVVHYRISRICRSVL